MPRGMQFDYGTQEKQRTKDVNVKKRVSRLFSTFISVTRSTVNFSSLHPKSLF